MEGGIRKAVLLMLVLGVVSSVSSQMVSWPTPPKWTQKADMARYLAHYADWGVMSAISPEFGHQPFGTVQSFADGLISNGSGTPYFYIAQISDTAKNIGYNNTVSFTLSQAMSDYCYKKQLDPEEPLCSRVTLTGQVVKVSGAERTAANTALFTRHPAMKGWPSGHGWEFYKLKLTGVYLLDFYGGCTHVTLKDYYSAKPPGTHPQHQDAVNSVLRKH